MFAPQHHPQQLMHQKKYLDATFSIMVWNVHKENQKSTFQKRLQELLHSHPSDLLLFQEYKHPKTYPCSLHGYSYAHATNIETKRDFYGVITASKVGFESIKREQTDTKEFANIATHKSLLITTHTLPNNKLLLLVNLHAINFVSLKSFNRELDTITTLLLEYKGAMIIGGDFNNWSFQRIKVLEKFQKSLGLHKAQINESHHIKTVFSKHLDHIFYRGVTLVQAQAIDTKKVSDHNPIYASFSVENNDLVI